MKLSLAILLVFSSFVAGIWVGHQPLWKIFASMAALG